MNHSEMPLKTSPIFSHTLLSSLGGGREGLGTEAIWGSFRAVDIVRSAYLGKGDQESHPDIGGVRTMNPDPLTEQ